MYARSHLENTEWQLHGNILIGSHVAYAEDHHVQPRLCGKQQRHKKRSGQTQTEAEKVPLLDDESILCQIELCMKIYIKNTHTSGNGSGICMVITYSKGMDQPGKPILLVVSRTGENNSSLSPFAPENLVSRDGFGSPVPRQPTHLHTQAESGAYL